MSAAGTATSMASFRVHPARRSRPLTPAMTITQATPTRRSAKLCWRTRSTPSPTARIGRRAPSSSPTMKPMAFMITRSRKFVPGIPVETRSSQGPRIPAIVISPYSLVHGISHEATEHGSIIKFIDELFNLTPLADLPDEASARALGKKTYRPEVPWTLRCQYSWRGRSFHRV